MLYRSIAVLCCIAILLVGAQARAMCVTNFDCKRGRLCVKGQCQDPEEETEAPTRAEQHHGARPAEPPPDLSTPQGLASLKESAREAGAPVDAAQGGIVTGMVFDVIGYALFVVGGLVSTRELGVGLNLYYTGGGVLTLGAIIGTASSTARHNAYVNAGFPVPGGRKAGAWTLTVLSILTYGAGQGMAIAAGAEGSDGLAIGAILSVGFAAIFEVINFGFVRPKWDLHLQKTAAATIQPTISMAPLLTAAYDPVSGRHTPVFGLAGAF